MDHSLAIISDTHLGDPDCALARRDAQGNYVLGPAYEGFKNALGGKVKYLILLGDIFDIAVRSYEEAYRTGQAFLNKVLEDDLADHFIYVPGNHDFELWPQVEYEVNIINRLKGGKMPAEFKHALPAVIDTRKNCPKPGFRLPGVTPKGTDHGLPTYGGLYLDNLLPSGPATFSFAYPNLYLLSDEQSILLTHGHYFEGVWAFVSQYVRELVGGDLGDGPLNMKELVALNFPINQLASSGVGQAGGFTALARKIQNEVRNGHPQRVDRYLGNLARMVDNATTHSWLGEVAEGAVLKLLKDKIAEHANAAIKKRAPARYDAAYLTKDSAGQRLRDFFDATQGEMAMLSQDFDYQIEGPLAFPAHVIFGHTHIPISWDQGLDITLPQGRALFHNTGGWILDDNGDWLGAEVFVMRDGQMRSQHVGNGTP